MDLDVASLTTPCVIVGAVAAALYMPQRATNDLDLLVTATHAPRLHQELVAVGCVQAGSLAIGGTLWRTPGGGLVYVLESDEPWARDAVAWPNRAPDGSPVIALPYLVLLKLAASRSLDVGDLARMLALDDEVALSAVRAAVAQYRPEDVDDLESLIALGRLELRDTQEG